MNLQQLEYVLAVDEERHFVRAAARCHITQATLSMMIKKLEAELGVQIFDRSQQPVSVTKEGVEVIERARKILTEAGMLKDYTKELRGEITGELQLAVIPTLAPYLLPLFIKSFSEQFPKLKIYIRELITDDIIKQLKTGTIDIGLLATPLNDTGITEHALFYEEFFAYAAKTAKLPVKKYILPAHIQPNHLWLLEEGHCMRNQLINFCTLKQQEPETGGIRYEAGSIETLIQLVDKNDGITIVPQLATQQLSRVQKAKLREFAPPKPVREISLVTKNGFSRNKLLTELKNTIIRSVQKHVLMDKKGIKIIDL